MKKYYYEGAIRVAMRTGTGSPQYLLSDHLGSTEFTLSSIGTKQAELRYKAWGETRYTSGNTQTTFRYTGQRQEISLGGVEGLYYYGARWYDSSLGRFVSADSIIPGAGNPQAWDRFAYVLNNPVLYNDPSGHCILCVIVALVVVVVTLTADTPQPFTYPVNAGGESFCNSALPDCFGDTVYLKDFSSNGEDNPISTEEFNTFADKVAEDLNSHDLTWPGYDAGRQTYDTPFYNGGESKRRTGVYGSEAGLYPANQQVCIESLGCSGRSDINYMAQGMWGAAVGEPEWVSVGITKLWKFFEYGESPSDDTLFWLDYGYDYYQEWLEKQDEE
jgi:RHS repeat-associated protein